MRRVHLVFALSAGFILAGITSFVWADDPNPAPSKSAVAFAERTGDLLQATLLAALTQEFDETTKDNVQEGNRSISLIFNDGNRDIRLVGTMEPMGGMNNHPRDAFEKESLALALKGQNHAAVVFDPDDRRWYHRRSIALSNFRKECALCHANFPPGPTKDMVGALMLRVPIE